MKEGMLFFICFKCAHNFSLKHFYNGCFYIFVKTILISLSPWYWSIFDQVEIFLFLDMSDFFFTGTWTFWF